MTDFANDQPASREPDAPVVVIGAGLAGLVAARTLSERSTRPVVVVDKGRSVGGRLATRRIESARLDHGAQFFTVRGDDLAATIAPMLSSGLVTEWCRGFNEADGYPRYAVRQGMNNFAKHLAVGLDVRTGVQISAVQRVDEGWRLTGDDIDLVAHAVVATAPVPQTLALLDAGGTSLSSELDGPLRAIDYHKVLALLVALDGPSNVPPPGGRQLDDGTFSFIGDNQAKGASDQPAVTFHVNHTTSSARWDDDRDAVHADLLAEAGDWIGSAGVEASQLKTWRYAGPVACWPDPTCVAEDGEHPLLLAGDAFAGPKFEGAFNSGRAAGTRLLEQLSR